MQIATFTYNAFQENTYVLYDKTGEAVIVDPGCYERFEEEELSQFISDQKLKVVKLINTHCHIDHVLGNLFVKEKFKVELGIPKKEIPVLQMVKVMAGAYGLAGYQACDADYYFDGGDILSFGETTLEILFVPGHSPGHVAFLQRAQKSCIGGDVLFAQSIGRTDLPGGHHGTLLRSIKDQLFTLEDETVVYPGHGPSTTIGAEKKQNPFLQDL